MPTVSKHIAENLIKRLEKQKKPKVYCVVRYFNTFSGNEDYCICYRSYHYDGLFQSPAVGGVEVIWNSERFKKDHPLGTFDDEDDWLMSEEGRKLIEKTQTRLKTKARKKRAFLLKHKS